MRVLTHAAVSEADKSRLREPCWQKLIPVLLLAGIRTHRRWS